MTGWLPVNKIKYDCKFIRILFCFVHFSTTIFFGGETRYISWIGDVLCSSFYFFRPQTLWWQKGMNWFNGFAFFLILMIKRCNSFKFNGRNFLWHCWRSVRRKGRWRENVAPIYFICLGFNHISSVPSLGCSTFTSLAKNIPRLRWATTKSIPGPFHPSPRVDCIDHYHTIIRTCNEKRKENVSNSKHFQICKNNKPDIDSIYVDDNLCGDDATKR